MKDGFGAPIDVAVGTVFEKRADLVAAGVHRETQKGIWGAPTKGAKSIVLSGGYEDDEDDGDEIIYTGEGGQDAVSQQQVRDQVFELGNRALARSCLDRRPVRVIRGARADSPYAPKSGLRYDGLYVVTDYWSAKGHAGFEMCLFRLARDDDEPGPWVKREQAIDDIAAPRVRRTITALVRNSEIAQDVKRQYSHTCQVCGLQLNTPLGAYAEAAHIQPLGSPHNGPDVPENLLCLCPNHHVLFDRGAFSILDDFRLMGALSGELTVQRGHRIGPRFLRHHRARFRFESS